MRAEPLTEIGRAYGSTDFALLEAAFGATDIPLFLHGAQTHMIRPEMALALGGMPIAVPTSRRKEAAALLAEVAPEHGFRIRWPLAVPLVVMSLLIGTVPIHLNATFPRYRAVMAARI
ncbi:hypothetical protein HCZ23_06145 [Celeribacter sp. HF31]|uniref:hypothetical protein n=1 Tax=Celeribacter sp. HF31 TaxID=2721558 RepID=UPI0014322DEE|nr:hypothetical protein [Celeribacter sp. HF31]NIY79046.1 hypothetical protein [Celeribacter sp. HF31]